MDISNCSLVGTLVKTHGIQGELVLNLNKTLLGDFPEEEPVFLIIDGLPVPFFVSEDGVRYPNDKSLFLAFEDIDDTKKAEELIGTELYAELDESFDETEVASSPNVLVGYMLFDEKIGEIGIIEDFFEIKSNPLLVVTYKGEEALIPLNDDLISNIDSENKTITMTLPEGLI